MTDTDYRWESDRRCFYAHPIGNYRCAVWEAGSHATTPDGFAEQIEGVGTSMFSGEIPSFGDELHIAEVGHFRVLRVDHHTKRDGDVFLVRHVVIVEVAP